MEPFIADLRGRGYELESRADNVWFASHEELPSLFLVEGVGGFLLRAYFGGVQSGPHRSPLEQVNDLNREAVVSRFFLDQDEDLVVEAWHASVYDPVGFSAFLEGWLRDIGTMLDSHRAAERRFDA